MVAVERILWNPITHRRYRAEVIDLGQKPPRTPNVGDELLAPEFDRVLKFKGDRRLVIELLQEEAPLAARTIAQKLDKPMQHILNVLTSKPEFYAHEGAWYLDTAWLKKCIDAGQAEFTKPGHELIIDYIREHGPSSAAEFAKVLNNKDAAYHLRKGMFIVVSPQVFAVYAATEKGKCAEYEKKGAGVQVLEKLIECGPLTREGLISRLVSLDRRQVTNGIRTMMLRGNITKVQEEKPQLWGLKEGRA
jgi:hypothetical protein